MFPFQGLVNRANCYGICIYYLKRRNFRVYLFSWAEKNYISRVLIFANGYFEKNWRVLIFENHEKETFFFLLKRKPGRK